LSKLFWALACVCVVISPVLAQDPTKVESKHYHLAFENEWVQVVDVHYGPHEKSGLHDHPGGVVVVLTAGHLRFTDQDGKTKEVYAKPGEARWYPAFKHKVENLGDTAYEARYIGIKTKTGLSKASPGGSQPILDAQTARILADYALAQSKR
jgi:beta-alanine degradation protein BauB